MLIRRNSSIKREADNYPSENYTNFAARILHFSHREIHFVSYTFMFITRILP